MTGRRAGRFLGSAAIALAALVLGAAEGLLRLKNADMRNHDIEMWRYGRILKEPSDNAVLDRVHRPSQRATLQSVDIRINADGLRGPELPATDDGLPRVIVLGSSITMGWGVAGDAMLTSRLARDLAAAGQPALVLNVGTGNYNAERYAA
jgi:hypothetical protein